jgi:MtrB/PioB family decaheme-associated outer membrane protein
MKNQHRRLYRLLPLLAALAAAGARADTNIGPIDLSGDIGLDGRMVWGNTGAAKFQEYRDPVDGPLGSFDLLLENTEGSYFFRGSGVNLGYDDQRYSAEAGRYGLFKLDFFYGELPNKLGNGAATLYTRSGGEFVLPAGLQATIQGTAGNAGKSAVLGAALADAVHTRLSTQWNETRIGSEYHVGEDLTLHASYRLQDKSGEMPIAMVFGNPGGNFITLPSPFDQDIHEVRTGADYVREHWSLSFDYLGSIFENSPHSLIGANPLIATDAANASSRGQLALPPDNSAHTWTLSGSASLPVDMPNRITGSFSYGLRHQGDNFLPQTINSAIMSPGLDLPKGNLDGEVHTILGNLVATARPTSKLGVELRGRVYDYDNVTDRITFPEHVADGDSVLVTDPVRSIYPSYLTSNGGLDTHYEITQNLTGHVGYGYDYWNRNDAREVSNLWESGPTAKLDWRPLPSWLLRTDYRYLFRRGKNYDPYNYLFQTEPDAVPADTALGQSPLLRKFDEADRDQHRFSLVSRINPCETTEIALNGGVLYTDYPDSPLGLTESLGWNTGIDASWQVHERVGVSGFYTYSDEWYDQDSRYRPVTNNVVTDDPLNDWRSSTQNWYHTGGVRIDTSLLPDVLDFETAYMVSYGREKTTGRGVPGGDPNGDAVNFPTVHTLLDVVTATLSWKVQEHVTLRAQYRFEDYELNDFRVDSLAPFIPTSNTSSRDIWLGNSISSYTAHIMAFGVSYRF